MSILEVKDLKYSYESNKPVLLEINAWYNDQARYHPNWTVLSERVRTGGWLPRVDRI